MIDLDDLEIKVMDHWDFVEKNLDDIYKLAKRCCRRRYDLVDDMVSDMIADRLPSIFENWDPTLGVPVEKKVWIDLRWYMYKWMNRRMRLEVVPFEQLEFEDSVPDTRVEKHCLKDEVEVILSKLNPYDAGLLTMHHLGGMTFAEMGDALDISKGTAHKHYLKALSLAQELNGCE